MAASPTTLSGAAANPYDTNPDDYGVTTFTTPSGLGGGAAVVQQSALIPASAWTLLCTICSRESSAVCLVNSSTTRITAVLKGLRFHKRLGQFNQALLTFQKRTSDYQGARLNLKIPPYVPRNNTDAGPMPLDFFFNYRQLY
jgi:hypothetical protein